MASYRIVCTEQEPIYQPTTHAHIVAVGVGNDPNRASDRLTKQQVINAIRAGDRFYTVSPSTATQADVEVVGCPHCRVEIIRSRADQVTDNNLDSLRRCGNWQ